MLKIGCCCSITIQKRHALTEFLESKWMLWIWKRKQIHFYKKKILNIKRCSKCVVRMNQSIHTRCIKHCIFIQKQPPKKKSVICLLKQKLNYLCNLWMPLCFMHTHTRNTITCKQHQQKHTVQVKISWTL